MKTLLDSMIVLLLFGIWWDVRLILQELKRK